MTLTLRVRWVLASSVGEALALALSTLLGALVARTIEGDAPWALAILMPLVGTIEGFVLGAVQSRALPEPLRIRWILATGAGMGVAWLLSSAMAFVEPSVSSPFQMIAAAGLFGIVVGVAVGASQSVAASNVEWCQSPAWVLHSMAAWVSAMVVSAVLSELVPWGPFTPYVLLIETLKGLAAGLLVGVVTLPALLPR
ncbi:MAG: hypothetical protein AAGE52_19200 [Myxococcota bacterium]